MVGLEVNPKGNLELELKFELSMRDVRKLIAFPAIKAMQGEPLTRQTLRAIYFDTPDLKLSKRGVSLRVRQENRRYVQCVKSDLGADTDLHATGGFTRSEWEWPVRSAALDLDTLKSGKALKAVFKGVNVSKLHPVFSTDIRRQTRMLVTPGGARIKCDIDQGRIFSEEQEIPIVELELELMSGDVGELLLLARMVSDIVPARLSMRTKAYRGFTLFLGQGHAWKRAEPLALKDSYSAEDVLLSAMMQGLRHLIQNEDCVVARSSTEGVHQMRVAMRRMRSLISTYKKLLAKGSFEQLSEGLNAAANELGPARDWDVFLDELLIPVEAEFTGAPELATLRDRAELRRQDGYKRADQLIASQDYARLLTEVLHWTSSRAWRGPENRIYDPAKVVGADILARRHARLIKAGTGLAGLSAEQRHQLRIAVKKVRYASEFFQSLFSSKMTAPYIRALRALQDNLGHLNDLTSAQSMMAELIKSSRGSKAKELARAAEIVEGWYAAAHKKREANLRKAWNAFTKAKVFW
ncbi:MAG: CYTH and CHAD domain-containing protein [Rhodospirillales bacterium]|nr:CYTH and CHAD domain-containing protein [Rhodospirillales bacterium]